MLKEELRECRCCNRILLASTNKKESCYSSYIPNKKNNIRYYNSWCKQCHRDYKKIYKTTKDKEQSKELQKQRYKEARDKRKWTVYSLTVDTTPAGPKRSQQSILKDCYVYTGITKQEPQYRLYGHLYKLKEKQHSNIFLQQLYNKLECIYSYLDKDDFNSFFKEHFIHFREVTHLDPALEYKEARLAEKLYVHRLEHNIRKINDNKLDIHTYKEMSIDLDYSKQTREYKDKVFQNYGIIDILEQ